MGEGEGEDTGEGAPATGSRFKEGHSAREKARTPLPEETACFFLPELVAAIINGTNSGKI